MKLLYRRGGGPCSNCLGAKKRHPKCEFCKGKGVETDPRGWGYSPKKCPHCKGRGRITIDCYRCQGSGKEPEPT